MYQERIQQINAKTPAEIRLKQVLIDYHHFQNVLTHPTTTEQLNRLSDWQCERLKASHHDLYQSPQYRAGLEFLFSDLYAAQDFSDRDRDLERIAPKLIKLLPEKVIGTVALLIELNLETQILDRALAQLLVAQIDANIIDEASYCAAYLDCNNKAQRLKQLALIEQAGEMLNKYARSNMIQFSLKVSKSPAEMAGLSALHGFIYRGFSAFHSMQDIPTLMRTLLARERLVLDNIFNEHPTPFLIHQTDRGLL
jgi:hypothetical protein